MSKRYLGAALVAWGALALAGASRPAAAQTIAITNAKIYPVSEAPIQRGSILIRDGRIVALGAEVAVPAGATVIDGTGKVVTPGFMDAASNMGIVEIGGVSETNDTRTSDKRITAAFNAADALNPNATEIAINRVEGITRAAVEPGNGASLIAGQGMVLDLGTEGAPDMIDRSPSAMYATIGESGARLSGGSRAAAMLDLREAFQDAKDYAAHRSAFEARDRRDYALSRLDLDALVPVVEGKLPLVIHANRASDITAALRLAREFGLRIAISGALEGWMVAGQLARDRVPVIIDPYENIPTFEGLGATLENAARLAKAGVHVAFATFGSDNSRDVKYAAGSAVANGMPYDAALRAVTLEPARIFGLDDRYGTLQPGKDADVVLWSGDPFELSTRVEKVYIKGREIPPDNRQKELLDRYRHLQPGVPPEYRH